VADIRQWMSTPPPSSAPPGAASHEHLLALEPSRSWGRRRGGEDSVRISPLGAVIEHERLLVRPLQLPLGVLALGLVDPGPAHVGAMSGRFPVLKRLSATAVVPRHEGLEGWLWTSVGGSALITLGDEEDAPNVAILFTKPLGADVIEAFAPAAAAAIAQRSPLGAPAVSGLLLRVAETSRAETAFRQYGLLKPLTDREVPPTMRRSLPTDRSADPVLRSGAGDARAATSVAPPGMG
jgi:hypothetical protein